MNRSHRILPVYTGDVSCACSALYELGGMVVIHDPSGCNSTYNTHDETRWYDRDSLIFISGLTEIDAIFGNDEKLIRDTVDAALELRPRFIALCSSPIPFINGTDFPAIARIIERRTGIPCFHVPTNGMHDYTRGAGKALLRVAERFTRSAEKRSHSVNILGYTPLDFGIQADPAALREILERGGFSVISCWSMGDGLEALSRAAEASVNLVVSTAGFPAAEWMWKQYGIPYVTGVPIGAFRTALLDALADAEQTGRCLYPSRDGRTASAGSLCVIGEPVTMGSLACAMEGMIGRPVRLICPLEASDELLGAGDLRTDGEEEAETALRSAAVVIGDPLYRPICSPETWLIPLPHQAFSGRNGWRDAAELISMDPAELLAKAGLLSK